MMPLSVGFAMSGSFCTFDRVINQIKELVKAGMEITPYFIFQRLLPGYPIWKGGGFSPPAR